MLNLFSNGNKGLINQTPTGRISDPTYNIAISPDLLTTSISGTYFLFGAFIKALSKSMAERGANKKRVAISVLTAFGRMVPKSLETEV